MYIYIDIRTHTHTIYIYITHTQAYVYKIIYIYKQMKAKVQNLLRKNFLEKERERELIMQSPRSNIILNPIHHRVKCK